MRQELANYVDFAPLNLLAKQYTVPGPFDAIFCRNVMIYFDQTTQQEILRRFVPLLNPTDCCLRVTLKTLATLSAASRCVVRRCMR